MGILGPSISQHRYRSFSAKRYAYTHDVNVWLGGPCPWLATHVLALLEREAATGATIIKSHEHLSCRIVQCACAEHARMDEMKHTHMIVK